MCPYEIQNQDIQWEDDKIIEPFLKTIDLKFAMTDQSLRLISSGKDITDRIRTPEIPMLASASSAKPQVRAALLDIQRDIGETSDAVFEGRDMGTVVFPDASHKFFLVADLNIRAKRRYDEMPDKQKNIEIVKEQMQKRDTNDSQRASAPLKPAPDAIQIDSSMLTIEQVVEKMLSYIEKA